MESYVKLYQMKKQDRVRSENQDVSNCAFHHIYLTISEILNVSNQ